MASIKPAEQFQEIWTKALKAHKLRKGMSLAESYALLKAALCTNVE